MRKLPSLEVLEATHKFPTKYAFKAIGRGEDSFIAKVVTVFRDELKLSEDPAYTIRQTSEGKHVSVSVEVEVRSAVQILTLYSRLLEVEGMLVLL